MALHDVLSGGGPFASVHMDASHDTEDARKLADLRWRQVRERLTELGTPPETVAALEEATGRPSPTGRAGRLLVGAKGEVRVDEYLADPPAQPQVRLSGLPYLLPLASWSERLTPYVVVAVDQTGADLLAVDEHGTARTEEVEGRGHHVHKVRGGGWAHLTLRRHTEETVRRNIVDAAAEAATLAERVGARLVILVGDDQSRARLREALPQTWRRVTAEINHSRGEDPSHHTVDRDISDLLAEQHRTERGKLLDRLHTARAHGLAVEGLADTTTALREGNAGVLLVDTRDVGDRTVWVGSDPAMVAVRREELHDIGVSDRTEARVDEALPAAAILTGADVFAATGDQPSLDLAAGVGALLRHD